MIKPVFVVSILIAFLLGVSGACFADTVHTVKSGDTLSSIAKKYSVSVSSLKSLNHISGSQKLKLGQSVVVKKDVAQSQSAVTKKKGKQAPMKTRIEEAAASDNGDYIEHRVRKGETLEVLATRYNADRDEIIDLNNLGGGKLKPGKTILIPKPDVDEEDGKEYVILATRPMKPWKGREEQYMLVKVAKSFMGAPYKFGGESVKGLDCSAYVKKIYDIFDVQLPRSSREQYLVGTKISKDELAIGDLVFFRTRRYAKHPTHVGIYIGDGNFIHSSSGQGRIGVKVDSLSSDYYTRVYLGATRVKRCLDENLERASAPERSGSNS